MKVVLADLRQDHIDMVAPADFGRRGHSKSVHSIRLDVTDRAAMAAAADETERVFGKVHVLVNNAGVGIQGLQRHHLPGLGLWPGGQPRRSHQRSADLPAAHPPARRGRPRRQHSVARSLVNARPIRHLCRGQGCGRDDLGDDSATSSSRRTSESWSLSRADPDQHRRTRQEPPAAVRRRRCVPCSSRRPAPPRCRSSMMEPSESWCRTQCTEERALRNHPRRRRPGAERQRRDPRRCPRSSTRRSSRCCRRGHDEADHAEPAANSLKALLSFKEKSLESESVYVDLHKFEQHEPWFVWINPEGQVPVSITTAQS